MDRDDGYQVSGEAVRWTWSAPGRCGRGFTGQPEDGAGVVGNLGQRGNKEEMCCLLLLDLREGLVKIYMKDKSHENSTLSH